MTSYYKISRPFDRSTIQFYTLQIASKGVQKQSELFQLSKTLENIEGPQEKFMRLVL